MNIGFLMANYFPRLGGMEFAIHNLVSSLNRIEGISASVACSEMPEIPKDYRYHYPVYRSRSFSVLTRYLNIKNREKMIRKQKVELLHGPMLHGGGWDALHLKRKFNLPLVSNSRGADFQIVPEIGYGALLDPDTKRQIEQVIDASDRIVALSALNKERLIELGADPNKISIVHNGIQYEEIQNIPFADPRRSFDLSDDDFLLITVGRNRPIKRMDLLFSALERLNHLKEIKCVCVGPVENLKELAADYNIEDKIIFTGEIPGKVIPGNFPPFEALINWYRASNLYVSTSYAEAYSGAATDALACGKPVIIGKHHGVRDVITPNATGFVMQDETSEELADLIQAAYETRNKLHEMEGSIRKSVSHLTWDNQAREMLDVYRLVIQ